MGVASLIPPLTVLPAVAYRIARWRAILNRGEPVLGRIDGVDNASGERLVRCSFDWAGTRHRIKLLVRPTPEVKALQAGAPEVLWVRPDHPRKALPQGLFVPRKPEPV